MTVTVLPTSRVAAPGASCARVAVTGVVDASNADQLRLALFAAAATHDAQLDIDLAGVTFMDCSGLRAIGDASLALERTAGLVLCNVPGHVQRILDISDLGRTLKIRT